MTLNSQQENLLDQLYVADRYRIINIICQTLLYGISLCLVPIAVYVMITNGLQNRSRKWLFAMTTFMFALSTLYWIFSVIFTFIVVDLVNNSVRACYGGDNPFVCLIRRMEAFRMPTGTWLAMFNDILLIDYTIADGVVVWRAWVLCSDQSKVVLMILVVMLAINTVIYPIILVLRTIGLIAVWKGKMPNTHFNILDVTQMAHLTFSLLINIFATSIIALKAWKYRKFLMESGVGVRTSTKAFRILALVVESGMIYILLGIMSVACIIIFQHFGFNYMSGLLIPVGTQLVGIYPIVVVLLVEQNRSLNSTYCSFGTIVDARGGRSLQAEPMSFAPGPMLSSGGQVDDLATKPSDTDIHVTSNPTLEPGGAGMSTGSSKVPSEEHAQAVC